MGKVALTAAIAAQPVIWKVLGYEFEAASMIAGLSACLMVRIWVSLNDRSPRAWAVDGTVTSLSLLFTAGWIVMQRPEPFYALMTGAGFGALGAGIIGIALSWVNRLQPLAGGDPAPAPMLPPAPRPDDRAGIDAAMDELHKHP